MKGAYWIGYIMGVFLTTFFLQGHIRYGASPLDMLQAVWRLFQ